jgi:hypothetical protein
LPPRNDFGTVIGDTGIVVRLAYAAWCTIALLVGIAGVLAAERSSVGIADAAFAIEFGAVMVGMGTLGVLITRHHPQNPIGWLFCSTPLLVLLSVAGGLYSESGHAGGAAGSWLGFAWVLGLTTYALFVPLLFPDGNLLPGRRWRLIARADLVVVAGAAVGLSSGVTVIAAAFLVLTLVLVMVSVASLVVRYRRAEATERLQIRWVMSAAIGAVSGFVFAALLSAFTDLVQYLFVLAYALPPAAIAIAILRFRLYEIDVIVRRTLTYACLGATLSVVYLGGVALVGAALRHVTGGSSTFAVTISTLAVAAAFQPLRRQIQQRVDHRFYRRRYDAQRAAADFSGRLREQIDLDALSDELVAVVGRTVQPATASLWLRPPAA